MNRQSAKELFEHVQKSNASWESLIPQRTIPFNFCASRVMTQFCEGLFANGTHGQGRGRETLNRADVRRGMEFLDLFTFTSTFDLPPNFSHVDLGLNILNFFFDCAQDLLLLYELRYVCFYWCLGILTLITQWLQRIPPCSHSLDQ